MNYQFQISVPMIPSQQLLDKNAKRYNEISADRSGLDQVLSTGRQRASAVAEQTLQRVQDAMGFARPSMAN